MGLIGLTRSKLVQMGPVGSKGVQMGPNGCKLFPMGLNRKKKKRPNMVEKLSNDIKPSKMAKNCLNWSKKVKVCLVL